MLAVNYENMVMYYTIEIIESPGDVPGLSLLITVHVPLFLSLYFQHSDISRYQLASYKQRSVGRGTRTFRRFKRIPVTVNVN